MGGVVEECVLCWRLCFDFRLHFGCVKTIHWVCRSR
jgi:hypothetical protein